MKLSKTLFGAMAIILMVPLPSNAGSVEDRVTELLPWVAHRTGYDMEHVKPKIFYKTHREIKRIYSLYYSNPPGLKAITIGDMIFLSRSFTLGKDDSTLVHELVHVLQNINSRVIGDKPGDFRCGGEREREALLIEDAWVQEFSIGQRVNKTMLFFARCPHRTEMP